MDSATIAVMESLRREGVIAAFHTPETCGIYKPTRSKLLWDPPGGWRWATPDPSQHHPRHRIQRVVALVCTATRIRRLPRDRPFRRAVEVGDQTRVAEVREHADFRFTPTVLQP